MQSVSVAGPTSGRAPVFLAGSAALLAALVVLPGCLGVAVFTHRFTAQPLGAWLVYVAAVPLYISSALLLVAAFVLARRRQTPLPCLVVAAVAFAAISAYGFVMHIGFMFQPVARPQYVSLDEAIRQFGENEALVGVLDARGQPYGYIARLARRPHIVHQSEGSAPFMMSHCILANSSMAYALESGLRPPRISIASVIANNLVYYDHDAATTVQQIYNCSMDRRHQLRPLPTVTTILAAWQSVYPESKVWVRPRDWRDTFYLKVLARASIIDEKSPDLVYPLQRPVDGRLPLKAHVMGVQSGVKVRAYPLEKLVRAGVVQDELDGQPLVFFAARGGDYVQLFSRRHPNDNRPLNFTALRDDAGFRDTETDSRWDAAGRCVAGALQGTRLMPVPHYNRIFWCVWADFFPQTGIYSSS